MFYSAIISEHMFSVKQLLEQTRDVVRISNAVIRNRQSIKVEDCTWLAKKAGTKVATNKTGR
jgi:hypothetical protein